MNKHTRPHSGTSNYPMKLRRWGMTNSLVRMPFIDRDGRWHSTMEGVLRNSTERQTDRARTV